MEELIAKAAGDLIGSKYAIALTGAGISTESGIPDFRGPDGIWTKNPEAEKKAYQSYEDLKVNPKKYWEERLSGGPSLLGNLGKMEPNPGHHALAELEKMGVLKWVITQNIDNLHRKAGTKNILEYHGNAFRLRCMSCNSRYDPQDYDFEKLKEEGKLPPLCKECDGVIKSDVVYFGEPIPSDIAHQSMEEAAKCDLMLICGTSAVVYPFAMLPSIARERKVEKAGKTESGILFVEDVRAVTIIEVNAEPTPLTDGKISDYLIQGKTGEILPKLVEATRNKMS